jgi:CBS domain-containing protein
MPGKPHRSPATPKRHRRPVERGEFSDPLKRYDGEPPQDELERAMCEGAVADVPQSPLAMVSPIDTIEHAVRTMADLNVGCLLVVENDRLVGIFTQSDLLLRVADRYPQVKGTLLRDVMTPDPVCVRGTDRPAVAINLMSVGGFRHIPVLDVDDHVVGLIGPRRVTAYLRQYFATP